MRTIDTLIIACHYLEFIGQRDFIVIVQAVDDGKVDTELVENICVETHLREVCHTQQLISGFARIHQRAQQVEQRAYSQRFAHRTDGFHCRIEQLGVQVGNVAFFHAALQDVGIIGEAHAMLLYYVACPADGSSAVIAVLGHFVTRSRHNEAGAGGDVERVLSVTARTYDVNGAIGSEVYRDSCLHKCFAKACQFVYCDAAHLKNSE